MSGVTGLWVYQTLSASPPDPDAVAARAKRHGLQWLAAQATAGATLLNPDWIRAMRTATRRRDMRLGVHGYIGKPSPQPDAEADAMTRAIELSKADFAIVNAEIEYERSPKSGLVRLRARIPPAATGCRVLLLILWSPTVSRRPGLGRLGQREV
jgi:hypothetical protein